MTSAQLPHGRTARRLEWQHLPPEVRGYVESRLGSAVARAESQNSGFTPGFASRLTGESGERLFVKAANKKAQRPFAEAYAEEARKLAALPPELPATRLQWVHEDEAWVILGFADAGGVQPQRPWRDAELQACLDTLAQVARVHPPDRLGLRPVHAELPALITGWDHVRGAHPDRPHADEAAALAARLPELPATALMHCDARDDNFLLTGTTAVLCDWNWPVLGAPWLDTVALLISVHGDGGDAESWLSRCEPTRDVPAEQIDIWLAAHTGFMLEAADRPIPPTSPYLRAHQAWYAEAGWSWLAQRRDWA